LFLAQTGDAAKCLIDRNKAVLSFGFDFQTEDGIPDSIVNG
jgi:hypothetical protein